MKRILTTYLFRLWAVTLVGLLTGADPLLAQTKPQQGRRAASILNVVVRVEAVVQRVDPARPWAIPSIHETLGTGFLVSGNRIVTNLELVRGARSITISSAADKRRYPARLQFQAFDAGLAVLTVPGSFFQRQRSTLPVTRRSPSIGARMSVYGFEGRGNLAVRHLRPRVIERKLIQYSDVDRHNLVFFQNLGGLPLTGYAGGPALQGGRLVGMFHHHGKGKADRNTYVIPNSVIQHVLTDIRDGRYDGFPLPVFSYSPATSPDQRKYLGLDRSIGGIIIDRVAFQATVRKALQAGDVLYQLNVNPNDARQWFPVNAAGQVIFGQRPNQRREILQFLHGLQAGQIKVRALRGGKKIERGLQLSRNSLFDLRRRRVFSDRKYFLGGGLIFQELDYEIVHEVDHPSRSVTDRLLYRYNYHLRDLLSEQTDREVVLTGILNDPINAGTDQYKYGVVESINGRRVRTLRDFAREWALNQHRYVSIKFLDDPVPLTLEAEYLEQADTRIAGKFPLQEMGRVR